jgi:hypothetical protein
VANPLTGDFDAVLEVSGSTTNRLMASLHQNAGTRKDEHGRPLPAHPHVIHCVSGETSPWTGSTAG